MVGSQDVLSTGCEQPVTHVQVVQLVGSKPVGEYPRQEHHQHKYHADSPLAAPEPGVEEVPHGVAEHVETVNDNSQERPRPERQPWRHLHVLTPFPAEHTSPAQESPMADRIRGSSEKPQLRITPPTVDAEYDDDDRHNIGHDMSDQCCGAGAPNCPRRQKVVILFNADNGASDHS